MAERLIWKGNPSQWINAGTFIVCAAVIYFIDNLYVRLFAAGIAGWQYLVVRCWIYEITEERIIEAKGVFSKVTNELELFRVKDLRLEQPFLLRIVNLSNIYIVSSDQTNCIFRLMAVPDGKERKEQLRKMIDERRKIKGVKEYDIFPTK